MRTVSRALLLVILVFQLAPASALEPAAEQIRYYSESILEGSNGVIAGQRVAAVTLLPSFYAGRGFRPAWSDPARFQELLAVLKGAESHGLNPDDYHYATLSNWSDDTDPKKQAGRDILATDALIRFGYHLHFGKVDPAGLDPDWNLTRQLHNEEPAGVMEQAMAAPALEDFLNTRLAPDRAFYSGLRTALARYRKIAADGGWGTVPDGPALRPDDRDERIPALRARLAVTDAAVETNPLDPTLYDTGLASAVERFQLQHGLDADGLVGPRTLAAMNVPVDARIDQLRVNLERTRWVFRDLEPRFLVVNIAGFDAYLVEDRKVIWSSRVQVGKPYRKTPVFKQKMTYLVLSPTWTIPPTILKKDIIPAIREDPTYLTERNMVLLDREGQLVDMNSIDFSTITPGNFPYMVRQEPGPKNALGRIKFMFPNKHFVYLHDTPSRKLFDRAERTTSSGCIRVEKPISLAAELLRDPVNWSEEKVEARIEKASNETVSLKNPITVFLMYWTSVPDDSGDARFFADVYSRDKAVLDGLQQSFKFTPLR